MTKQELIGIFNEMVKALSQKLNKSFKYDNPPKYMGGPKSNDHYYFNNDITEKEYIIISKFVCYVRKQHNLDSDILYSMYEPNCKDLPLCSICLDLNYFN